MKKLFWICFLSVFVFADLALAQNRIELWHVQHRKYEDGREFNRVSFAMMDESNNYILEDILASMELFDPDGIKVEPSNAAFGGSYQTTYGYYDSDAGQWRFNDYFNTESWYFFNFDAAMKPGNYQLVATDKSGIRYEATDYYGSAPNLPIVSSKSFCASEDENGNLVWTWEIPEKFISASTSVRTWVTGYDADGIYLSEIYIKVPTHMGWAFAPANLVQQMKQMGSETLKIGMHIRTNDGDYRTYATDIDLEEAKACGCDINGDNMTGLEEAIHALRVVAGIK